VLLGTLVFAAVLAALLVKLLYGTTLGHSVLDRVPDEAWGYPTRPKERHEK